MKLLPLKLAWILQSGKEVNNFDTQDVSPGLKYFEEICAWKFLASIPLMM